ncbi:unnamed protein product [Allacma fusca]|uniref:CRAL-TRIO domain-containing protein n=1 Tax=Allacma fusca TaxID=39272 RepID=A0A8J2KKH5_9HEXA|nr:unnamed protein product [Allacma fusca]
MSRNNNNSLLLQIETVEELRRRIIDKNYLDPRKLESNTFLLRYLKFFHMDISKAEKMLKNYWKYCNSKKLECFAIEIPNRYKPIFQIYAGARDYQNRPVIQVPNIKDWQWKLSNGFDKTDELFVSMLFKRLHWYLEKELLAIDAEYAIIILDFQDMPYTFSLAKQVFNLCVEFIKELMPVSPNIFAQSIVVNGTVLLT